MAKRDIKEIIRRRPSIFWWTLANLLAAAFAVTSWVTCYFVFNFPEKPSNYELLRKVKRLAPVEEFPVADAPDGRALGPQELFPEYLRLDEMALAALNRQYQRNYIANFQWSEFLTYVEGTYRVTHVRPLIIGDFFHPGLAVRGQAYVQPEDPINPPGPYPVVIELLLPTADEPSGDRFRPGDEFVLQSVVHRAAILHAARTGTEGDR